MAKKVRTLRYSQAGTPSPNTGKYVLFGLVALVILIIGFSIGKATSSSKTKTTTQKQTALGEITTEYGPKKLEGIVPVGFSHSEQGAVTAATSYISLVPRLYFLTDQAFNTSVTRFTTTFFAQDFRDRTRTNRAFAQDIYSKDNNAFFREFPLGYVLEDAQEDSVTVSVWSAVMLAARPEFDGKTESKIHTMTLVWENNDWKVSDWVTVAGPTPNWQSANGVMSVDDFLTTIKPFDGGYSYVPSF